MISPIASLSNEISLNLEERLSKLKFQLLESKLKDVLFQMSFSKLKFSRAIKVKSMADASTTTTCSDTSEALAKLKGAFCNNQ